MTSSESVPGGRSLRALALLAFVWGGASACASATTNAPGSAADIRIATVAGQVELLDSEENLALDVSRDIAWQEAVEAHREIGLGPVAREMDETAGAIQVTRVFDDGTFAGESLGRFVSCGEDSRLEAVDYSDVELTVLTRVRPFRGQMQVGTRVGAVVRSRTSTNQAWSVCRSTGVIENRILGAVRGELAPGSAPVVDRSGRSVMDAGTNGTGEAAGGGPPAVVGPPAAEEIRAAMASVAVGDRVRIYVDDPWERMAGPVMEKLDGAVQVREGMRPRHIALNEITELQIRRQRRSLTFPFALVGAGVGALVFAVTDVGISGNKAAQGDALNPFLGAVVGSIPGAVVGALLGGDYWETVARVPGR